MSPTKVTESASNKCHLGIALYSNVFILEAISIVLNAEKQVMQFPVCSKIRLFSF